jgi:hypothetical protein
VGGKVALGKVALKNIVAMEDSKRLRSITIIVWAIVKHIVTTLRDKDDDSDKDIFYTPPQSPTTKIPIFSNQPI